MPQYQLNPGGDPTVATDYTETPNPSCSTGTDKICYITANDNGSGSPVLTPALKDEMIRALHFRASNPPTVQLKLA